MANVVALLPIACEGLAHVVERKSWLDVRIGVPFRQAPQLCDELGQGDVAQTARYVAITLTTGAIIPPATVRAGETEGVAAVERHGRLHYSVTDKTLKHIL